MATLAMFGPPPDGAPLPNPVDAPKPGRQSLPASEQEPAYLHLRNADREANDVVGSGPPRVLSFRAGSPPQLRPAGTPDRLAHNPNTDAGHRHDGAKFNPHRMFLAHGELDPLVSGPGGADQNPQTSNRRNTFRLAPQPWDTGYFVSPSGAIDTD